MHLFENANLPDVKKKWGDCGVLKTMREWNRMVVDQLGIVWTVLLWIAVLMTVCVLVALPVYAIAIRAGASGAAPSVNSDVDGKATFVDLTCNLTGFRNLERFSGDFQWTFHNAITPYTAYELHHVPGPASAWTCRYMYFGVELCKHFED